MLKIHIVKLCRLPHWFYLFSALNFQTICVILLNPVDFSNTLFISKLKLHVVFIPVYIYARLHTVETLEQLITGPV